MEGSAGHAAEGDSDSSPESTSVPEAPAVSDNGAYDASVLGTWKDHADMKIYGTVRRIFRRNVLDNCACDKAAVDLSSRGLGEVGLFAST